MIQLESNSLSVVQTNDQLIVKQLSTMPQMDTHTHTSTITRTYLGPDPYAVHKLGLPGSIWVGRIHPYRIVTCLDSVTDLADCVFVIFSFTVDEYENTI